jgi:hypothetical protein
MKRFKKVAAVFLALYLTSYLILSSLGNYYILGLATSKDSPSIVYQWFPAGTGISSGSREFLFKLYKPLNLIDSKIWHNKTSIQQVGPDHQHGFPK